MPGSYVPPMTDEQLEFFTRQTDLAVRKALRKYSRAALAGFLILMIGVGIAFHNVSTLASKVEKNAGESRSALVQSGRAVAVDGCNGRFESQSQFRDTLRRLDRSNALAYKNGTITAEQRRSAKEFYRGALGRAVLPDCRLAAKLLTDNLDEPIPSISPRYPGDGL
jgi:hypothetical protein